MRCAVCLIFCLLMPLALAHADPRNGDVVPPEYILYVWNNTLYAQSTINQADVLFLGENYYGAENALPDSQFDVYTLNRSPITEALDDGFHHGVWSRDGSQFAYLTLEAFSPNYQIYLWENGASRLVIASTMDQIHGYLDPIGWSAEGKILLAERFALHHLDTLRVWQFDLDLGQLAPYANASLASNFGHQLRGRSAVSSDGQRAFLGFEAENQLGYFFDFDSRATYTIPVALGLPEKPPPVFERLPYKVLGIVSAEMINAVAQNFSLHGASATLEPRPAAFLHWFLPDANRRITCYPDSTWTQTQHNVTCPALGVTYEGHQGTDVGGTPDGLPIGTAVYAAAPGVVVQINTGCPINEPSCGQAYGNYVMLEHTLVVNGNTQQWVTGYAHLSEVKVEPYMFISDIRNAIGASGNTGTGGAHTHFEVRYPHAIGTQAWLDPWDVSVNGTGLWLGGNETPIAATEYDPEMAYNEVINEQGR